MSFLDILQCMLKNIVYNKTWFMTSHDKILSPRSHKKLKQYDMILDEETFKTKTIMLDMSRKDFIQIQINTHHWHAKHSALTSHLKMSNFTQRELFHDWSKGIVHHLFSQSEMAKEICADCESLICNIFKASL